MKLKQIRKSKGMTAAQLLELVDIGLTLPQYSAIESGKVLPTWEDLQALCAALLVDVEDVIEESDMYHTPPHARYTMCKERKPTGTRFDSLPTPHPKRTFRMSNDEWGALHYALNRKGYNSVGAYLRHNVLRYGR